MLLFEHIGVDSIRTGCLLFLALPSQSFIPWQLEELV